MHPALCHNDQKLQSAIRQASGVMTGKTFRNVRDLEHLAQLIRPHLNFPSKLGDGDEVRSSILLDAVYLMHYRGLISFHKKKSVARATDKCHRLTIEKKQGATSKRHIHELNSRGRTALKTRTQPKTKRRRSRRRGPVMA